MTFIFLSGIADIVVYAALIGFFHGYLRPSKQS